MTKSKPAPKPPCPRCGNSGQVGKKKTFDPLTGKPVRVEPIPCTACT